MKAREAGNSLTAQATPLVSACSVHASLAPLPCPLPQVRGRGRKNLGACAVQREIVFSAHRPYLSPRARTRLTPTASAASAHAHGVSVYRHQRLGVRAAAAVAAAASDVRFAGLE